MSALIYLFIYLFLICLLLTITITLLTFTKETSSPRGVTLLQIGDVNKSMLHLNASITSLTPHIKCITTKKK